MIEWWALILVILSAIIGGTGALFFKLAAKTLRPDVRTILTNNYLWIGGLCYFLGTSALIISLKGGQLSTLYPFVALSYPWVMLLSILFLDEKIPPVRWLGTTLIVSGVILIGLGS